MSLPRIEFPLKILNKYDFERMKDQPETASEASKPNIVADYAAHARDYTLWMGQKAFFQLSEQDKINMVNDVRTQLEGLDSFDKCKHLIFDLGDYAYKAAENKFKYLPAFRLTTRESRLCNALHAVRSFMVEEIINNKHSLFHDDFKSLIDDLKKKRKETHDYIAEKRSTVLTEPSDKLREYNEITAKLTYLGDQDAIDHVISAGLLERLPRHTKGAIPVLLRNYHKLYFNDKLREIKSETYEEYCLRIANETRASNMEDASVASSGLFSGSTAIPPGDVPTASNGRSPSPAP